MRERFNRLEEEARERRQKIVEQNGNSGLNYPEVEEDCDYVWVNDNTPTHYDNTNGSLYKIAIQRGWNAYQFDAIKRIDRVNKKGQFKEDVEKTITVLKLMLKNE